MDYFVIGFLWGIGRFSGDSFLVQSTNKKIIERIRDAISSKQKVYPSNEKGKETTWRLKLRITHPYVKWMEYNGYEGRKGNIERNIPVFENVENEAEFLRGYFRLHYSHDIQTNGLPRLRFYGSLSILNLLNKHLEENIGTTKKKIQNHKNNDICKIIYYQSKKEIPVIFEYLKLKG